LVSVIFYISQIFLFDIKGDPQYYQLYMDPFVM